jgi:hypothetical protein
VALNWSRRKRCWLDFGVVAFDSVTGKLERPDGMIGLADISTQSRTVPEIPDEFDVVIRSYHDGPARKFVCNLTPAVTHRPTGSAIACDSIEASMNAALLAQMPTPVDANFWTGLKTALPLSLLAWGVIIAMVAMIWN